jgi:hypothetical protein
MSSTARAKLAQHLRQTKALLEAAVDCQLEAANNVGSSDWEAAQENLAAVFRNAASVAALRATVLRELRHTERGTQ